jgi:predicted HTH domain antitoxin
MAMQSVTIELPEEIVDLLGGPELAAEAAKRAIVIELFRTHKISQGKAAEVLGISKFGDEMHDIMKEYGIYHGPQTIGEIEQEIETIRRFTRESSR